MLNRVGCHALLAASITLTPGGLRGRLLSLCWRLTPPGSLAAHSTRCSSRTSRPAGTFRGVIERTGPDSVVGGKRHLGDAHPPDRRAEPQGAAGSPYAARDYRAINPAYGNAADFRALIQAAHPRGMKLILDWVPDHTSADHPWVKEHPEFYVRDKQGKPSVPREPDGKLTDWTDVLQLDYSNPAVRREMIATMRYWLEQFNLDGFRVDVAGFIPYDFWREAVPALRAAVPRPILLLAEWGDPEMHRVGFDLTYAWESYDRLKAVWQGGAGVQLHQGRAGGHAGDASGWHAHALYDEPRQDGVG